MLVYIAYHPLGDVGQWEKSQEEWRALCQPGWNSRRDVTHLIIPHLHPSTTNTQQQHHHYTDTRQKNYEELGLYSLQIKVFMITKLQVATCGSIEDNYCD